MEVGLTTNTDDIEKLVESAAQENSYVARQRLFRAIRLVEVFFPYNVEQHGGKEVRSTPLLRLSDGTHAMMLFTSKAHPHLSEHDQFAGGTFKDALAAALKMPELDWVILSNRASQWVAISKQQIPAVLDDLHSGRPDQVNPFVASETDPAAKMVEDLITRAVRTKSEELSPPIGSVLADRELFLELAAGESEDGQPVMKNFRVEQLRHVVRAYTTRLRPGIRYGGIRWEALKDMIRIAPEIGGVQIVNNADDWVVFDRESLGFGASEESE